MIAALRRFPTARKPHFRQELIQLLILSRSVSVLFAGVFMTLPCRHSVQRPTPLGGKPILLRCRQRRDGDGGTILIAAWHNNAHKVGRARRLKANLKISARVVSSLIVAHIYHFPLYPLRFPYIYRRIGFGVDLVRGVE
jgi:hypothetical protein